MFPGRSPHPFTSACAGAAALVLVCLSVPAAAAARQHSGDWERRRPPSHLYKVHTRDAKSGARRYGFIDRSGKLVIGFDRLPERTVHVGEFREGRAVIQLKKEGVDQPKTHTDYVWGFIDETGAMVIAPRFDYARDFSGGLAYVSTKGGGGFIDRKGRELFKVEGLFLRDFHEGLAAVGVPGGQRGWGYIDRSGKVVIERQYDLAGDFSEGLAAVSIDRKYGFINRKGEMVIPPRFRPRQVGYVWESEFEMGRFSEGLAWAEDFDPRQPGGIRNLYGYINKAGDFVIPPQFAYAQEFSEGLAWAVMGDRHGVGLKVGWVDRSGRWAVEGVQDRRSWAWTEFGVYVSPQTDWRYSEGLVPFFAYTKEGALSGYMDRKGAVVIPPGEMRMVGPFSGGVARVTFHDETVSGPARYGRVDEKGQFVEEYYGYINKSGRFIWRSK